MPTINEIFSFSSISYNSLPSLEVSWSGRTKVAPLNSGKNNSKLAISKEIVEINGTLSVSLMPGSFSKAKSRLTTFLFDILAPFGLPVEPDVYKRYNTFSGSTSF